jgi:two-component system, OmpR family, phosphate regulon response regulator OmpR
MKKMLLVDDDTKLQDLLRTYLEAYGFTVRSLLNGMKIMEAIAEDRPDIIILDIMMPGKDGLEVLKEIRSRHDVPVIMLTARGDDMDRIVGLELGADDYLSKPFNPRELLARMKAVLRRVEADTPAQKKLDTKDAVCIGELELDLHRQVLRYRGGQAELSTAEFKLLEALMERPNTVLSRDTLMSLARGRDFMAFDRSIDVHISHLRAKLESLTGNRDWIKTHWGSGYLFVDRS